MKHLIQKHQFLFPWFNATMEEHIFHPRYVISGLLVTSIFFLHHSKNPQFPWEQWEVFLFFCVPPPTKIVSVQFQNSQGTVWTNISAYSTKLNLWCHFNNNFIRGEISLLNLHLVILQVQEPKYESMFSTPNPDQIYSQSSLKGGLVKHQGIILRVIF